MIITILYLTIKKDPTKEPVTIKEYDLWKKSNNNPCCLTIRASNQNRLLTSHNPFDVLSAQSFNRQYVGGLEKIFYDFFDAIINNHPIYEHLALECGINCFYMLRQIDSNQCTVEHLIQTYGKESVQQTLNMANRYASRKYKEFLSLGE